MVLAQQNLQFVAGERKAQQGCELAEKSEINMIDLTYYCSLFIYF
jgi:hypothetical protein